MDNVLGSKSEAGSKLMAKSELEIADAWAKITIKRWLKKIQGMKIGSSGELAKSFLFDVISSAQGDLVKIDFAFNYYGKFIDMGVGRGTSLGDVKENITSRRLDGKMLGNRRRPKKWYSKTFHAEVMKLSEILSEQCGRKGVIAICENINDNSIA